MVIRLGEDPDGDVDHLQVFSPRQGHYIAWFGADIEEDGPFNPGDQKVGPFGVDLLLQTGDSGEFDGSITGFNYKTKYSVLYCIVLIESDYYRCIWSVKDRKRRHRLQLIQSNDHRIETEILSNYGTFLGSIPRSEEAYRMHRFHLLKRRLPELFKGQRRESFRFYGAEDLSKNMRDPSVMLACDEKSSTCLSVNGSCAKTNHERSSDKERIGLNSYLSAKDDYLNGKSGASASLSFHGRQLPAHLISLESLSGQELFHEAFRAGHARNFFSLITNFASQSDVSMCGPASLAMVLNALKLDPMRTWKRPWRWWSDEMFACCEGSLQVMKRSGVTLEFFDRIAKQHEGIKVETRPPGALEDFRRALLDSARTPDNYVIVSFGREVLGQTGIGHFSPVAAIHPERDLVLVLDVARFKYPPYWVKVEDLHRAMFGIDPETGISRGYSIITKIT